MSENLERMELFRGMHKDSAPYFSGDINRLRLFCRLAGVFRREGRCVFI